MAAKEQKYLSEINFSELLLWDVKSFFVFKNLFNDIYSVVLFGDFLERSVMKKIQIEDEKTYKILGVRSYGKGVYVNRTVKGNTLKMKTYQEARLDHLFWCKVDTKNGAFGIVRNKHDNGLGSSNMTFAKIDEGKINIDFLEMLFKSPKVYNYLDQYVSGTTNRKYIKPDQLLNEIKIPLPSLSEQNKIVEKYNQKIKEAENAEKKAKELEKDIEEYLMEELGIEKTEKEEKKKGLQEVNFKDIFKWGIDKIVGLNKFESDKFKITNLEKDNSLYVGIKRGKSPKYSNDSDKFILNQKCNRWDQLNLNFVKTVNENWFDSIQKDFFTKEGDILVNSTGEGTIGRASSIDSVNSGLLYDSHLLMLRLNKQIVNYKFYTLFFNTKLGQEQIDAIKSAQATKQTELGVGNLKKISFPLPPLSIQNKIVEKISAMKEEIKSLKKLAEDNRKNAITEFETEIFSQ